MSCPRRTSWWFPFVLPGSPLPVVSESAGPSRWAAEAGAEECPFVVEAMREPMSGGLRHGESVCSGSRLLLIGYSAPWGEIQAHPQLLVSNGSGPLHFLKEGFSV